MNDIDSDEAAQDSMCLCFSPATKIRFSRVEANVYLLGGGGGGVNHIVLKHTAECVKVTARRSIIGQYMEIWFFNPLCSNGLSHTD